jgi:hypothetical protein
MFQSISHSAFMFMIEKAYEDLGDKFNQVKLY